MNDKRSKTDSTLVPFLISVVVGIGTVTSMFIKKVIKADRLQELYVSAPILVIAYYLLYLLRMSIPLWLWLVPFSAFALYWACLFSQRKITNAKANPCWANRNWWWTLDGWSFEQEVAEIFRLNGYLVEVTKKTGDGGVDLILWKNDVKTLVQCKHFRMPIPVAPVRELNGIREDYRGQRLLMVASSGVSPQGYAFVRNKPYYNILTLDDIIELGLNPNPRKLL